MKKLKRSVMICLTVFLASSCDYNPKKLDIYFMDFDINTCAKYKITETKPEIKFTQIGEDSKITKDCLKDGSVLMGIPLDQALELKRYYEAEHKKKENKN